MTEDERARLASLPEKRRPFHKKTVLDRRDL